MKSRAAVLRGVGVDWEVTDIELDPPRAGEVLVKMAFAGICHSDEHFYTGDSVPSADMEEMMRAAGVPVPEWFPMLGGHEGAGVVEKVGPDVRTLRPGDHVAVSFFPACGNCRWCATGHTYLCDVGADIYSKDMTTDHTRRRHVSGPNGVEDLMAMMQVGTFSEYVVASERSLVKINDWIPLEAASRSRSSTVVFTLLRSRRVWYRLMLTFSPPSSTNDCRFVSISIFEPRFRLAIFAFTCASCSRLRSIIAGVSMPPKWPLLSYPVGVALVSIVDTIGSSNKMNGIIRTEWMMLA